LLEILKVVLGRRTKVSFGEKGKVDEPERDGGKILSKWSRAGGRNL
jgi:hypothetical protein